MSFALVILKVLVRLSIKKKKYRHVKKFANFARETVEIKMYPFFPYIHYLFERKCRSEEILRLTIYEKKIPFFLNMEMVSFFFLPLSPSNR